MNCMILINCRRPMTTAITIYQMNQCSKLNKTLENLATNVSNIIPILKQIETYTRSNPQNSTDILENIGPKLQELFREFEQNAQRSS